LVREALVLQIAASELVTFPRASDPRPKAVLALTSLQRELLRQGWEALLAGRYAAALLLARMIDELNDYVPAVSFSEEGARLVLEDDDGWGKGDACKVLEEHEWQPKNPSGFQEWSELRKDARQTFNRLAHTAKYITSFMVREVESIIYFPIVPTLDEKRLKQ